MKIDSDLRLAIRSAEKAQPQRNDWEAKRKAEAQAILAFFKRFPAKARKAIKLAEDALKAEAMERELRSKLCEQFGLKHNEQQFQFSNCGRNKDAFVKAGGHLPEQTAGQRWTFDAVMAELVAADPKQLKVILKKYNIRWE